MADMHEGEVFDRKSIRSALLGKRASFRRKTVELEGFGTVEVIQPTVKQRAQILSSAMRGTDGGKPDFDFVRIGIEAMLALTLVPGTDERVFEIGDREEIENAPAGGWIDDLSQAAMEMLNVEEAGKNFE